MIVAEGVAVNSGPAKELLKLEDEEMVGLVVALAELGPRLIGVVEDEETGDEEAMPELASGGGAVDTTGSPVLAENTLVGVNVEVDDVELDGSPVLGVNASVAEVLVERAEEEGPHWPVAVTVTVTVPSTPVVVTASPRDPTAGVEEEENDEAEVVGVALVGVGKGVELPELAPKRSEDKISANPVVVVDSVEVGAATPVEENILSRLLSLIAAAGPAVGEDLAELRLMGVEVDWKDWEVVALTAEVVREVGAEAESASVRVLVTVTTMVVATCRSP